MQFGHTPNDSCSSARPRALAQLQGSSSQCAETGDLPHSVTRERANEATARAIQSPSRAMDDIAPYLPQGGERRVTGTPLEHPLPSPTWTGTLCCPADCPNLEASKLTRGCPCARPGRSKPFIRQPLPVADSEPWTKCQRAHVGLPATLTVRVRIAPHESGRLCFCISDDWHPRRRRRRRLLLVPRR